MYRNIVVAYDGSDGAEAALQSAAALADASGGTIHLVQCTGHLEYAEQGVVREDSDAESRARSALDQAADQLDEVSVVTSVVKGNPVQGIISAAERVHADVIVTGSRGQAVMPEAVLGRVTSGVVSSSPCDVLVVHPTVQ
jgi:nucleotide-binding universal stress UspA family protein